MSHGTEVRPFKLPADLTETNPADLAGLEIRVLLRDEEPWFVHRDVCRALGLRNVSDALMRLDDDEYQQVSLWVVTNDPSDHQRKVTLINEAGLYGLIIVSRVPTARAFKRWIKHDVLPEIRRTGAYGGPPVPASFAEALELAARQARELESSQKALAEAAPKVEAFDQLMDADGSLSLAQAAQALRMGRDQLIEKLALWGGIMVRPGHSDHLRPYQEHVRAGRFVVKVRSVDITHRDGSSEVITQGTTRVTPKGLEWCRQKSRVGTLDRAHAQKIRQTLILGAEATA